MKQVLYFGPTNIRHHHTKFSCHGNVAPVVYALLPYTFYCMRVTLKLFTYPNFPTNFRIFTAICCGSWKWVRPVIDVTGRGGKKGAVEQCPNCRGTGMQVQIQQLGPGMIQQIQSMCSECRGQGERINPKDRCKTCQGKKVCIANLQTFQRFQVRMCHVFLYHAHWRSNK